MPKQGNPFIELLPRDLIALFGAHDLKDSYEIGRQSLSPEKIQVHRDWNPSHESFDADIAILTFQAGAIMFSTYVQPICLWKKKADPTQTEGYIGGWGQSQNLEKFFEEIPTKLKVPIHANEFCFLTTKDLVDLASNRTFCAGKGNGRGVCDGDSGGGVSIKFGSTYYFRGIISSGLYDELRFCDVTKFSIFTDVLKFKPWIDQIMCEDGTLIPNIVQSDLTCTTHLHQWNDLLGNRMKDLLTCSIDDQKIDREGFSVAGKLSTQAIRIFDNKEVNFLPGNIADAFPKMIVYEAYNCALKTIQKTSFKGLKKLKHLNLASNEIEWIDGDSFKDLTKLGFLNLSGNKIKTVNPNWFQSFDNLWKFSIGDNHIEFLDEEIFDDLRNVRDISLENNILSTIPEDLFKNNLKLQRICFNLNNIETISSTMFDHLKNLTYVDLRNNSCVNMDYSQDRFEVMKNVLRMNCTSVDQTIANFFKRNGMK